jgi:hypothetical protein
MEEVRRTPPEARERRDRIVRMVSYAALILGLALVVAGQMGWGPLRPA